MWALPGKSTKRAAHHNTRLCNASKFSHQRVKNKTNDITKIQNSAAVIIVDHQPVLSAFNASIVVRHVKKDKLTFKFRSIFTCESDEIVERGK